MARPTTKEGWDAFFAKGREAIRKKNEAIRLKKAEAAARGEPPPKPKKKYTVKYPPNAKRIWQATAELTGGTEAEARMWYDAMCAVIYNELANHRTFAIPQVGTLQVYSTERKVIWNPYKKAKFECDGDVKVRFKMDFKMQSQHFKPLNLRLKEAEEEPKPIKFEDLC